MYEKNIILFMVICSLFFSINTVVFASGNDLLAAESLANQGYITKQNISSDYRLDDKVLRQEIALISRRVSGLNENSKCRGIFGDVTAVQPNNWVCGNVESLVDQGIISKNINFNPEQFISKSEALLMFVRASKYDFVININSSTSWQSQLVDYAVGQGIIERFLDYDTLATRGWIFRVAGISIEKKNEDIMIIETNIETSIESKVKEFTITAKKWSFTPSQITVNKGDTVKITINSIDVDHGFYLSAFDISEKLEAGEEVTIEFVADTTGKFSFFCSVYCGSGHGAMNGELIVK